MRRSRRQWSVIGVLALTLLGIAPASNASAATCGFASVVGLSFGAYDVFGPNVDAAGGLTYSCTGVLPGDTVVITLDIGGAPSFTPRQMQSGPYRLDYNIFLDATRISIWGDGTGGSGIYGPVVPLEAAPIVVPMYGRIPSGQDAHIGTYSDTIIVTMSF